MKFRKILSALTALLITFSIVPANITSLADETPTIATIGSNSYETLEAALAASADGDTVNLCQDITLNNSICLRGITLNLNGHTLTFKDVSNPSVHNDFFYNYPYCISVGDNNSYSMTTSTISNGTIVNANVNASIIITSHYGSELNNVIINDNYSNKSIINFSYSYISSGFVVNNSTFNISAQDVIYGEDSTLVTLNNSIINNTSSSTSKYSVGGRGNVIVNGGTINDPFNILDVTAWKSRSCALNGGTYKFDPTPYLLGNMEATANKDGTWSIIKGDYKATIGSKKYKTIQDAIDAAGDGDSVILQENYSDGFTLKPGVKVLTNGFYPTEDFDSSTVKSSESSYFAGCYFHDQMNQCYELFPVKQCRIGKTYYHSLFAAANAAKSGDVINLKQDFNIRLTDLSADDSVGDDGILSINQSKIMIKFNGFNINMWPGEEFFDSDWSEPFIELSVGSVLYSDKDLTLCINTWDECYTGYTLTTIEKDGIYKLYWCADGEEPDTTFDAFEDTAEDDGIDSVDSKADKNVIPTVGSKTKTKTKTKHVKASKNNKDIDGSSKKSSDDKKKNNNTSSDKNLSDSQTALNNESGTLTSASANTSNHSLILVIIAVVCILLLTIIVRLVKNRKEL